MKETIARQRIALAARLAQLRGERSQKGWGKELGVNYQNLNRYERGHQAPHVDFLILLAIKERVSLNWLLLGKGSPRIRA
jgi:transcriptional regulator with XRE-family HTH domain